MTIPGIYHRRYLRCMGSGICRMAPWVRGYTTGDIYIAMGCVASGYSYGSRDAPPVSDHMRAKPGLPASAALMAAPEAP